MPEEEGTSESTSAAPADAAAGPYAALERELRSLRRPAVVVASGRSGDGRSTTALDLARSFAVSGRRVVLVDLDLRNPSLAERLDVSSTPGASEVLSGTAPARSALQYVPLGCDNGDPPSSCWFLPAGARPPGSALESRRLDQLIRNLSIQADMVLIDSAPLDRFPDALSIGRSAGGALLVANVDRTSDRQLARWRDRLVAHQVHVFGTILTSSPPRGR